MIKNPSKIPLPNAPRIALVKLSALGDIVHAAVVLQFIKKHLPAAQISWIADAKFSEILRDHPLIDRLVALPLKEKKFSKSYAILKNCPEFDVVIDLQGLVKSALVAKILAKKKARVFGFDELSVKERLASKLYTHKFSCDYGENIIVRNLSLAGFALNFGFAREEILAKSPCFFSSFATRPAPRKLEISEENLSGQNLKSGDSNGVNLGLDCGAQDEFYGKNSAKFDDVKNIQDDEIYGAQAKTLSPQNADNGDYQSRPHREIKRILIAPFASEESKIYDKFSEVINLLKEYEIFLCASGEKERTKAAGIAENSHARLLPEQSLAGLIGAIESCDLIIGNDSGVTHLAWAQNRPSIALFGNRPAERNAYETPTNLTLSAGKKIDARKIDKKDFCVRDIAPRAIANAAKRLLDA